jgi:hypothetical protein
LAQRAKAAFDGINPQGYGQNLFKLISNLSKKGLLFSRPFWFNQLKLISFKLFRQLLLRVH